VTGGHVQAHERFAGPTFSSPKANAIAVPKPAALQQNGGRSSSEARKNASTEAALRRGPGWQHIATEHPELAGLRNVVWETIANADSVVEGNAGALLAVRRLASSKALVVAYREVELQDGLVIMAFVTSRVAALFKRRRQLWPRPTE
jgi:hypothetical protein